MNLRKYSFKFDRQIEGVESCDVTVLADTKEEAQQKFDTQDWSTFLIKSRQYTNDIDTDTTITGFTVVSSS